MRQISDGSPREQASQVGRRAGAFARAVGCSPNHPAEILICLHDAVHHATMLYRQSPFHMFVRRLNCETLLCHQKRSGLIRHEDLLILVSVDFYPGLIAPGVQHMHMQLLTLKHVA